MSKQTGKTISKVLAYILVLLVFIGVFGLIAKFTDGFTSDFKTFYVSVDGKDVMSSSDGFVVTNSQPLQVDVHYTFSAVNKDENKGYSVKIVPNKIEGENFEYIVDDEICNYFELTDLSGGFNIEKGETSFTVTPKGETLTDVLSAVYGKPVSDCTGLGYNDLFTIIVTSFNDEASVKLNFALIRTVTGITLDKEVIEF